MNEIDRANHIVEPNGMVAEITCSKDGYIRHLSIAGHGLYILHRRDGATTLGRQDGRTIQIREEDLRVINQALEKYSRFKHSDAEFFKFTDSLFEQFEALP